MNKPLEQTDTSLTDSFLVGGGEMGKLVRTKNWSDTPLGPIESWPISLRTAVSLVLNSNFPISLAWGPDHIQIYNDGYWPICGVKHPTSMGQDFSECWASAFPVIGEAFQSALNGTTAFLEDRRMFLDRLGYLEETFFTFSFSPIRDEHGAVAGLFHPVTETTSKMVGQRRTRLLRDLTGNGLKAQSIDEALQLSAQTLAEGELDVPFVLFYQINEDQQTARLAAHAGLAPGGVASPIQVNLAGDDETGWPMAHVAATCTTAAVDDLQLRFPGLICGPYPEPLASARVISIAPHGYSQPIGLMVVGISTRLPMNEAYLTFLELLDTAVNNVVASALAITEERRRVEALAEIDRAKTVFFSNVSHEFRTPLTLMLGPLEDELAERTAPLPEPRRERLEAAHRNSLRLLKLVNTLLDFSMIEAGRAKARYIATDLARSTTELASTFRSAIEKAGLTLNIDCPALPEPVFVDHDMWEKIVLNLLSNAFKHTFNGGILVTLRWCGEYVELDVADSGIGISAEEMPRLFERFHRVQGARSRTHEGSGIGLALVQELVRIHGGTVRAASEQGRGTTFSVTLKTGRAHLPDENIFAASTSDARTIDKAAYVDEALQWIRSEPAVPAPLSDAATVAADRARIVWADDNADMRNYVYRLLSEYYDVTAVSNGAEAVAIALAALPDLVLTDIMMPVLDGFGMLRELRADQRTRHIPVIFLSARAGEEESIDGLEMGADDYLVKPFAARELLARVRTHLELAKLRREWAAEREFRQLAEAMPQIVWVTRPDGWTTYFSQQWTEYTGLTLEESYGHGWNKFFHPDDQQRAWDAWQRATQNIDTYSLECRLRRADGAYRWWLIRGVPLRDESGAVIKWFGTCTDIHEIKQTEQELRISATAFETQEGMIITDENHVILKVNHAFTHITGYSSEEAVGNTPAILKSGKQSARFYQAMWKVLRQEHYWQGEIWNKRKNGEIYPEWLSITAVVEGTGRITNYVACFSDISPFKKAEETIHTLANYDLLTQLPNRRQLHDRLQQILLNSARSGKYGAILFIDLDDFKTLNNTKSHEAGDLLLIEVARRLQTTIHANDTIARVGADEFLVILNTLNKEADRAAVQAKIVAERVHAAINQPFDLMGCEYQCTSSIGITLFRDHEITVDDLLKHSGSAMSQAKQLGRNTIRFFDPATQSALESRALVESWMRKAIPDQFRLYYQIQVNDKGMATGAEALIRWHHPEQGVISPAMFIPLAEETGLILRLGQWVLETACAQLKAWAQGKNTRHLILAVNVSAKQFRQPDFVERVLAMIDQTGADPDKLKLELTESMLADDLDDIIVKMNALKAKGVRFSLDDFGTGFSSLSYLKRLPLNQLKIDQSFVRDALTDPNDAAIVRTIIALGQSLGLDVIAEGVETEEQRNFLAVHGCYHYQGYFFSRPVPLEEFEQLNSRLS
ncbi:MAG TPA: EAL domain-containing protein [Methylobacter sp.]|jgi:diguanylate cyclase (GGDEF)-like protein/PAS domain S-box-containing protein